MFKKLLYLFCLTINFSYSQVIEEFYPQGYVKNLNQVKVRFAKDMVPLGDLRDAIKPFDINCDIKGDSYWADTKTWIYQFDNEVPAGYSCSFKLRKGEGLAESEDVRETFTFNTGSAKVYATNPEIGSKYVDENQVFIIFLDGEVDRSSVLKNVYFKIPNLEEKFEVEFVEADARQKVIREVYISDDRKDKHIILIKSKRNFPSSHFIHLIWGKGVKTKSGFVLNDDQVFSYQTRPPLTLKSTCSRRNKNSNCSPFSDITFDFSMPVHRDYSKNINVYDENGNPVKVDFNIYRKNFWSFVIKGPHKEQSSYKVEIKSGIIDFDERKLSNEQKYPLNIEIDEYPPLLKFPSRFGILEFFNYKTPTLAPLNLRKIEDGVLVKMQSVKEIKEQSLMQKFYSLIGLRGYSARYNIDEIKKVIGWMQVVGNSNESFKSGQSIFKQNKNLVEDEKKIEDLKLNREGTEKTPEVIGIPFKHPGFYIVDIGSKNLKQYYVDGSDSQKDLNDNKYMYEYSAFLVTDLSVHFKWGRENSLVWVTHLSDGSNAKKALVSVVNAKGDIIWEGETNSDGCAKINRKLESLNINKKSDSNYFTEYNDYKKGLFVFASKGNDSSFVHSSWDRGIEPWRFVYRQYPRYREFIAKSILDRELLRRGETLHLKNIIRKHTTKGMNYPLQDLLDRYKKIVIKYGHWGDEVVSEFDVLWNSFGTSDFTWKIPQRAKLGHYRIIAKYTGKKIEDDKNSNMDQVFFDQEEISLGSFQVEDYKVPIAKSFIKFDKNYFLNQTPVLTTFGVEYLAGGAASNLPVTLNYTYSPLYYLSSKNKNLKGYTWDKGDVRVSIHYEHKDSTKVVKLKLNQMGNGDYQLEDLPKLKFPARLRIQLDYKDPNGEIKSNFGSTNIYLSELKVGIKTDSWLPKKNFFNLYTAVTSQEGKVVPNQKVEIELFKIENVSHRKKLVGGFYAYEHRKNLKSLGNVCSGKTDSSGTYKCSKRVEYSGNIVAQVTTYDKKGIKIYSYTDLWIPGSDDWWFDVDDSDRIDVLSDKDKFQPGDKAKLQIRAPFKEFRALITLEREGVIDYFIKELTSKNPTIEIPIKDEYAPNVYLSVLAVRGRVDDIKPTSTIDLGKPSYKVGFKEIKVGIKKHKLDVSISHRKKKYSTREMVEAEISVKCADGSKLPDQSEVVVAVVDKGLLLMKYNNSVDILHHMLSLRNNQVSTFTAQTQVVGKRHFGKKALPFGGGGGMVSPPEIRELFDTLLTWQPNVQLDKNGKAKVKFQTVDSLTQYEIVAIAIAGPEKFGTGKSVFSTSKDLMVFSGIPKLARVGDMINIEFTLKNSTKKMMNLDISLMMNGMKLGSKERTILLNPLEDRKEVWKVEIPRNKEKITYNFIAKAIGQDKLYDSIQVEQIVKQKNPIRVLQGTFFRLDQNKKSIPIQRPKDAISSKGGILVDLRSSIVGSLSSVKEFMSKYPYSCLEQKISSAIATHNIDKWNDILNEIPHYQDSNGFFKYFPDSSKGNEVLTSYIMNILYYKGWKLPQKVQDLAIEGLLNFVDGKNEKITVSQKIRALEALGKYKQLNERHLDSVSGDFNLFSNSTLISLLSVINSFSKNLSSNFSIKLSQFRIDIYNILQNRLSYDSGMFTLSDAISSNPWMNMTSEDKDILKMILVFLEYEVWKDKLPEIILGAISRQKRGTWDLTTANAYGVLAVQKFVQKFEKDKVTGASEVVLGTIKRDFNWDDLSKSFKENFSWQMGVETLELVHNGTGKPWVNVLFNAAIPLKSKINSGYRIIKTFNPVKQSKKGMWSVGDLIEVNLEIYSSSSRNNVVIDDPIPVGASIIGKGIGDLDFQSKSRSSIWPEYQERNFDGIKSYYKEIKRGKVNMSYTIRLNIAGIYKIPSTRVEALYHPATFGEIPNEDFVIAE